MQTIKYFFEYGALTPFYNSTIFGFIPIEEIEVNCYLKEEVLNLNEMYESTYNDDYPAEPLLDDNYRNYIFANRVIISAKLLQKELQGKYNFEFDWKYWENEVRLLERKLEVKKN